VVFMDFYAFDSGLFMGFTLQHTSSVDRFSAVEAHSSAVEFPTEALQFLGRFPEGYPAFDGFSRLAFEWILVSS
jgi:hypothetical protein